MGIAALSDNDRRVANLASRSVGSTVVVASDESFGEKENLLEDSPAAFEAGRYGPRGEVVDGWETRRRRAPGHDWAVVRLGTPGVIESVDVDTSYFTGNHPESCRLEATGCEGYPNPAELVAPGTHWQEIVGVRTLRGGDHNILSVSRPERFTHVRLSIFPDGGVARLRVNGFALPDPRQIDGLSFDLAGLSYGGFVLDSSDGFYSSATNLNRPDRARSMGEGWETRRRRDAGHDFVVLGLGAAGHVRRLIVDTAYFRYNASAEIAAYGTSIDTASVDTASVDTASVDTASVDTASAADAGWVRLLARQPIQPDTTHVLAVEDVGPVSRVRIDAFPDGGLSRVQVLGTIDPGERRRLGYRWYNSLPGAQAARCLSDAGVTAELAEQILRLRPLSQGWVDQMSAPVSGRAVAEHSGNTWPELNGLSEMLEGPGGHQ